MDFEIYEKECKIPQLFLNVSSIWNHGIFGCIGLNKILTLFLPDSFYIFNVATRNNKCAYGVIFLLDSADWDSNLIIR